MSSTSLCSRRAYGSRGWALPVAGLLLASAATASAASGPRPLVAQGQLSGRAPQNAFEYAAKVICGAQEEPKDMRLARGFYATTINVHNPNAQGVRFFKKLALTIPPGDQRPGKIIPIAIDSLEYDQALAVDCDDIVRRAFGGSMPAPFFEGFIVIQSPLSLDVTAVYSTATVRDGVAEQHSGIHVEQVKERVPRDTPPPDLPDLTVQDIEILGVSCPNGPGSCVTTARVTIANLNAPNAGPFNVKTVFDPAQSVVVNTPFPAGLTGTTVQPFIVVTPPGGNCFDPDCTICATVDSGNTVTESNEGNNQLCKTTIG